LGRQDAVAVRRDGDGGRGRERGPWPSWACCAHAAFVLDAVVSYRGLGRRR
jgi:hypothetical protein